MYSYQPLVRVTPPAGAQIIIDLAAISTLTIAQWVPEPMFQQKETVRRRLRNIKYGWRLHASFAWAVDPQGAGEASLVNLGYYVNRNAHTLELSMDNGTLYRECVLSGWTRTNSEKKNVLGIYQMDLTCIDLLSEDSIPPELLQSPPALGLWHG